MIRQLSSTTALRSVSRIIIGGTTLNKRTTIPSSFAGLQHRAFSDGDNNKVKGKIKWYNFVQGIGFIGPTDGSSSSPDVFLHYTSFADESFKKAIGTASRRTALGKTLPTLLDNEEVEFEIIDDLSKGGGSNNNNRAKKAINVTGMNGVLLQDDYTLKKKK